MSNKREESTLRKADELAEKIVAEFLDKNFYNNYYFPKTSFERTDCIGKQLKGIDIIISNDGYDIKCDEKAAIHYVNKNLKTFAFELSFINRNNEAQLGWFLNKNSENTHYVLVWINQCDFSYISDISHIREVDVAYIQKDKIYGYLKNLGWTGKNIINKMNKIRMGEVDNSQMGDIVKNGFRFHYSQQLVEKPINILLSKGKLKELSDKFVTIYI